MLLHKLTFLIHPFCYGAVARAGGAPKEWPYQPFEEARTVAWYAGLEVMREDEGLALLPFPVPGLPATAEFGRVARRKLGARFFILDRPAYHEERFWRGGNALAPADIAADLRDLCVGQGTAWNKEELETALHARTCVELLRRELERRRLRIAPRTLRAAAWGASFEGCVTKYSLELRRLLGLAHPVEIDFGLTVPDATFLLGAACIARVTIAGGVRLFVFQNGRRAMALFVASRHTLRDPPRRVSVPAFAGVTVRDKRGVRLWPRPVYQPVTRDPGLAEPSQALVHLNGDRLEVPVCTGYVYRLAKAPAYVFAPLGMPTPDFLAAMSAAEPV